MNNKITARGMAEGALMAALAAIFMLAGNLPFIGLFVLLFCSIPITVATVRNNPLIGGLSAVLAVILALLFLGPIAAVSGGLQFMLLGWVLGYMLYHHKSSNKTIGAGVITAASAALVILLFTLGLIGFTPASITAYMDNYTADMMEMYQSTGMIDMMAQQGVSKTPGGRNYGTKHTADDAPNAIYFDYHPFCYGSNYLLPDNTGIKKIKNPHSPHSKFPKMGTALRLCLGTYYRMGIMAGR